MNQQSEKCVQYEGRHKQKQAPHQTKSIIDAISWNWPRIGWMAVVIIMIKTVTQNESQCNQATTKPYEKITKTNKQANPETDPFITSSVS